MRRPHLELPPPEEGGAGLSGQCERRKAQALLRRRLEAALARFRRPDWRTVIAWIVAAPWLLWTLVRGFGLECGFPLVPLMAYTPYVAVATLVPAGDHPSPALLGAGVRGCRRRVAPAGGGGSAGLRRRRGAGAGQRRAAGGQRQHLQGRCRHGGADGDRPRHGCRPAQRPGADPRGAEGAGSARIAQAPSIPRSGLRRRVLRRRHLLPVSDAGSRSGQGAAAGEGHRRPAHDATGARPGAGGQAGGCCRGASLRADAWRGGALGGRPRRSP